MVDTESGSYQLLQADIPAEMDGCAYQSSLLLQRLIVSFYANSKSVHVQPIGADGMVSDKGEVIANNNKPGCTLVSQFDPNKCYYYVYPEQLHVVTAGDKVEHKSYDYSGTEPVIAGTSMILEDEHTVYCVSSARIVSIDKAKPEKPKSVCPLDNAFSSFAKESCVLSGDRVLLADSVVNMGNVHFKVWDLNTKKPIAQLYRVPGENEPDCSQVFGEEVYMSMGTSIYHCKVPTEGSPDGPVTIEFDRVEFHDRSVQSFIVEQDYAFVGDSYGMITLHSFPGFEYHYTLTMGHERDEQVKHFDERPVFSFRHSVVGMRRVYEYLVYWLLDGTVGVCNYLGPEQAVDRMELGDGKHQMRDAHFDCTSGLGITMRFNVLKDQHSAIVPVNEFYRWDIKLTSPIPQGLVHVGFFEMFPTIIANAHRILRTGTSSRGSERLQRAVAEAYHTVNGIVSIQKSNRARIPFEFFVELVEAVSEAHLFALGESRVSQDEIVETIHKAIGDLIVCIDDSVAIAQHKVDMLRDPGLLNPTESTSFSGTMVHYNDSVRKHFLGKLADPQCVVDDGDHRMKYMYMTTASVLLQKQLKMQGYVDAFNDFCSHNDVGALVDADNLVQVDALLKQMTQELREARDDVRALVSESYAADQWLGELDYIEERLSHH